MIIHGRAAKSAANRPRVIRRWQQPRRTVAPPLRERRPPPRRSRHRSPRRRSRRRNNRRRRSRCSAISLASVLRSPLPGRVNWRPRRGRAILLRILRSRGHRVTSGDRRKWFADLLRGLLERRRRSGRCSRGLTAPLNSQAKAPARDSAFLAALRPGLVACDCRYQKRQRGGGRRAGRDISRASAKPMPPATSSEPSGLSCTFWAIAWLPSRKVSAGFS